MKRLASFGLAALFAVCFALAALAEQENPVEITTTVPASHTVTVEAPEATLRFAGQPGTAFAVERQSQPQFLIEPHRNRAVSKIVAVGADGTTVELTAQLQNGRITLPRVYQDVTLKISTVYAPVPDDSSNQPDATAPPITPAPASPAAAARRTAAPAVPAVQATPAASPAAEGGTVENQPTPTPATPAAAGDKSYLHTQQQTEVVIPTTVPAELTEMVRQIAGSVRESGEGTVLQRAALQAAEQGVTAQAIENARQQLAALTGIAAEELPMQLVTTTHWRVELVTVETENGAKTVALEITPYYVVRATTDAANMTEENTVLLRDETDLTIAEPIELTLDIPAEFAAVGATVYVTHYHSGGGIYYYSGVVEQGETGPTMTFTNPNGFSRFVLSLTDPQAAQKTGTPTAPTTVLAVILALALALAAGIALRRRYLRAHRHE